MTKALYGTKIAFLAANGFNEKEMTQIQRGLTQAGAHLRIVSPEHGLINGWSGEIFGHHYAIDAPLSTALGADYTMLIVPGGHRSHDKLKLTAHTKRFINSFLAAQKPVAVLNDAVNLLSLTESLAGRTVCGPEALRATAEKAGAIWTEEAMHLDGNLLSGNCPDAESLENYVAFMVNFFISCQKMSQAA